MNHIFKKIWKKSLGRMVVVSEHAKSAGKTDNTTGGQSNSLSNVAQQRTDSTFVFKPFLLKSLVLCIASISGMSAWADENAVLGTASSAMGSGSSPAGGRMPATTLTGVGGYINSIDGVAVVSAATSWNNLKADLTKLISVNDVSLTMAQRTAFVDSIAYGGNIALGTASNAVGVQNFAAGANSSAVGFGNTASGAESNAVGYNNKASGGYGSAVGSSNTASGYHSSAVGVGNTASDTASNSIGIANTATNLMGTALGIKNTASGQFTNAVGLNNTASGRNSNALGVSNMTMGLNSTAVGSGLSEFTPFISGGGVILNNSYTPTMTTVSGVTTLDGVQIETTVTDWNALKLNPALLTKINGQTVTAAQAQQIIGNFKVGGNLAFADNSSVFGINAKAMAVGSTAIGLNSVADEANTISVGRAGAEKRITNVATPTKATDAANKGYVDTKFASVTGGAVSTDNYAHNLSDAALGSASGSAHATIIDISNKIISVAGITVTTYPATAGTSIDDIDSFTVNGTTITDATKVAAFKNAAKKGGNIAVGTLSSAVGVQNIATGGSSNAVGVNNTASGTSSSAVGYNNTASSLQSSALGYRNTASGGASSAMGFLNTASGGASSAVGYNNTASGGASSAVGYNNTASGGPSSAMGRSNTASGYSSSAVGNLNAAIGQSASALGSGSTPIVSRTPATTVAGGYINSIDGVTVVSTATSWTALQVNPSLLTSVNGMILSAAQKADFVNSILFGGNIALGTASNAVGSQNFAAGNNSSAVGFGNRASEIQSSAVGSNNQATQINSSAFGSNSIASHAGATALGNNSATDRDNSISVGKAGAEKQITFVKAGTNDTDATNLKQVQDLISAIPTGGAVATDNYARNTNDAAVGSASGSAHGITSTAGKITSVAGISVTTTGAGTSIDDIDSFTANGITTTKTADPVKFAAFINAAKKGGNIAVGNNNSAMGVQNTALGIASSAVGYGNTASNDYSSAVGSSNTASGFHSSAVGVGNTASGLASNSIGIGNTATDWMGTALGVKNTALGINTNAVGLNNTASGRNSNALGTSNMTMGQNSTAVGSGLSELNSTVGGGTVISVSPNFYTPTMTTVGGVTTLDGVLIETTAANWVALSANPNLLTKVNGQTVTAVQAQQIIENFKAGGNLAFANNSSVFGINAKAMAVGSTAIGLNSVADEANTISVGRAGAEKRITNVATPTKATDAANKGYVDTALNNFTGNADTVLYDAGSNKETLTLQGASGTKITNLKDATLDANSKDAVTGKQLNATNTAVASKANQTDLTTGLASTLTDAKTYTDQTATTTLTNAQGYTDGKVTTLTTQINGIDGRVTTNTNDIALLKTNTGNLAANAVMYDSASKETVTLAGTNGTKITNLKDATLDVTSTDAVTGRQLHAVDERVTNEVGTLNTRIGTEVGTINTRIDGVDTRVGNEVTALNTRVDTTNSALVQVLGGGAAWNNGVFTAPTYMIQGKAKNTVSDAFIAVDQHLGAIKTSVSDLKTHTDQQAASYLDDAKNYTNQQTTTALNNAKGYTDQQTTSALTDAKNYTDQKAADGKAYTDQQAASALNDAKSYADQKTADGKAYTDQQTASALNDAKSYADQKAASSLNGAKDYTDQKTASAISSANSYTDSKIAEASNQFVQVNGVANAQVASATGENSVAIGANTVVTGNRSTAVGVGNQVSGNGSGAFGDPNTVSGNASYAVGNDNKVTGDNTFVLGNNVDTNAKNAVVLGSDSASDRDNTVSVGAKGKERQIIHVADAVEDTDAVNYQQLKASEKSANSYTNERVNALNSALNDYRMETEQRFQKVDERFNRQGAMTAAMMNMASSTASVRGQNRVGIGAGFQGQEKAVSMGYQRIINENTSLTIGGAFTEKESSGGVGVGFGW